MEDETLIESILPLIGILIIFAGFLMIMAGIALGLLQNPESKQDYSRRTESFEKSTDFENEPDSWHSPYKRPPVDKVESKVRSGGVIMLGPIPIIFGSDNESAKTAAVLAIILMILSLLILRGTFF